MKAVVLTIGDELLIGQVVNTNASTLAASLAGAGIAVLRIVAVGDDGEAIHLALRESLASADVVVLTGGLGPTHDDVTKRSLAAFFDLPLVSDPDERRRIAALLQNRGAPWSAAAEEQTLVPQGATILPNRRGTAGGIWIERSGKIAVALPGVPDEMGGLLEESVLPALARLVVGPVTVRRTLRTAGIAESALAERLGVPASLPPGVAMAFLPSLAGVRLRLDARAATTDEALRMLDETEDRIRLQAGRYVYGAGDEELETVVGRLLREAGLTLACAESCTGGAIARKLTSVPGASSYFLGSVVAYHDRLKSALLGVDPALIERHGAVSREVALAMASGARLAAGAQIGLAVTGIAGPGGGSDEKPVGTVWIGFTDGRETSAVRCSFGEGRLRVMERASAAALDLVRRKLSGER